MDKSNTVLGKMVEHYNPQVPESTLIGEINQNYAAARSFYSQRRQMFQKMLGQNSDAMEDEFLKMMNDIIAKEWQENVFTVMSRIWSSKDDYDTKIQKVKDTFPTGEYTQYFIQALRKNNFPQFKGKMGFAFEEWIKEKALLPVLQYFAGLGSKHLEAIVSGALKSMSAVTTGSKNIRSDLLVYLNGMTFTPDDKGVLKSSSSNLPLELTRPLTLDIGDAFPKFDSDFEGYNKEILNEFQTNGDFFGFSAKVYNSTEDNKHFSQSAPIATQLNNVFNRIGVNGPVKPGSQKRHSWDINYANTYVIWNLSRVLISIISPTTIAMTYGDQMMWMEDFLAKKVFYMQLSYQTKIGNHLAGEGRIFPNTTNTSIVTKNFDMARGLTAIGHTINENKVNWRNKKKYTGIDLELG